MSKFLREQYQNLEPYTPGEQPKTDNLIKLNTNENPYGPGPRTKAAISGEQVSKLMLYPDPEASELVEAISQYYELEKEQVMVGNGSDEILAFSFMAFASEGAKVYFPDPSYGFYKVYADIYHSRANPVPLTEDLRINPDHYKNLDGTIIIANPNAPTGIALNLNDIEAILSSNRSNLVIIDEAYIDFGAKSCVPFLTKYDNLLVIQTFSKSRSLAGARVGFAMGGKEVISDLNRIKFSFNPYNLNRLSILAAAEAIRDEAYFQQTRQKIIRTREKFTEELKALGFTVLPSAANFVFARSGRLSGKDYFTGLRERNILVRYFGKEPISDFVRITIGREEDMEQLICATRELLGKGI
ncbi:histidinol-phosphate transaminase [Anaerovorax odorimutans]|uniref:Histidinol-phosphate aminotransferase n=1 Tax=Anaerovorax odorimutans TaxID=109327 RepID=A0ABT1RTF8_9FIRM|nr:histidinol-phosphate transaminase [Anaerovorax odorimutans]MCQ4638409.1 histidinol-phosphate transaminase [Anaerovorax odorimutans]